MDIALKWPCGIVVSSLRVFLEPPVPLDFWAIRDVCSTAPQQDCHLLVGLSIICLKIQLNLLKVSSYWLFVRLIGSNVIIPWHPCHQFCHDCTHAFEQITSFSLVQTLAIQRKTGSRTQNQNFQKAVCVYIYTTNDIIMIYMYCINIPQFPCQYPCCNFFILCKPVSSIPTGTCACMTVSSIAILHSFKEV